MLMYIYTTLSYIPAFLISQRYEYWKSTTNPMIVSNLNTKFIIQTIYAQPGKLIITRNNTARHCFRTLLAYMY